MIYGYYLHIWYDGGRGKMLRKEMKSQETLTLPYPLLLIIPPLRLELGTRSYPRYQSFLLHGAQGPTLIAQLVTHTEQNSRH